MNEQSDTPTPRSDEARLVNNFDPNRTFVSFGHEKFHIVPHHKAQELERELYRLRAELEAKHEEFCKLGQSLDEAIDERTKVEDEVQRLTSDLSARDARESGMRMEFIECYENQEKRERDLRARLAAVETERDAHQDRLNLIDRMLQGTPDKIIEDLEVKLAAVEKEHAEPEPEEEASTETPTSDYLESRCGSVPPAMKRMELELNVTRADLAKALKERDEAQARLVSMEAVVETAMKTLDYIAGLPTDQNASASVLAIVLAAHDAKKAIESIRALTPDQSLLESKLIPTALPSGRLLSNEYPTNKQIGDELKIQSMRKEIEGLKRNVHSLNELIEIKELFWHCADCGEEVGQDESGYWFHKYRPNSGIRSHDHEANPIQGRESIQSERDSLRSQLSEAQEKLNRAKCAGGEAS